MSRAALAGSIAAPTNVSATQGAGASVTVGWAYSTKVSSFNIERGLNGSTFSVVGTTSSSARSWIDTSVAFGTTYYYRVTAVATGSRTGTSSAFSVTIVDNVAPSIPTGLTATAVSCSQINLSWNASTDTGGSGVKGYNVYRNGAFLRQVAAPATSTSDTSLLASTSYSYAVAAVDNRGNTSALSGAVAKATPSCSTTTLATTTSTTTTTKASTTTVATTSSTTTTTLGSDTTPPSVPTGIVATAISCSQVGISWNASTDFGSGVQSYKLYRYVSSSWVYQSSVAAPATSTSQSGLTGSSTYFYTVSAVDKAGNESTKGSYATVKTPACTGTTTTTAASTTSLASTTTSTSTTTTTKAPTTSTSTSTVTTTSSTTTTLAGGPALVGFLPGIGTAHGTAVVTGTRTLLYAASEEFGLSVADVTTPGAPMVLGASNVPFFGEDVVVVGSRAVVIGMTTTGAGLWVLDVTDPAAPRVLGTFGTTAVTAFSGVAVNSTGTLAVVSLGTGGVWTIDISTPSSPVYRGAYNTPGNATGITLVGTRLYVADGAGGLVILDVTNPSLPTLLGSKVITGHLPYDVVVSGNYAYVTDSTWLFLVFDVSIPSSPLLKAAVNLPGPGYHLSISGTRVAYLTTLTTSGDSIGLIDVTSPTAPVVKSTVGLGTLGMVDTLGLALTGSYAYAGAAQYGLRIFDTSLVLRGTATDTFTGDNIASANNVTVIAGQNRITGNAELKVMVTACPSGQAWCSGATPSKPRVVGTFSTSSVASFNDVVLNPTGTLAVVSLGSVGVWTIDLTTPTAPAYRGAYNTAGNATGLALSGSTLYVADGSGGLVLISVANPSAPALIGAKPIVGHLAYDVAVSGTWVYVTDSTWLFLTFDVSVPSTPVLKAALTLPGAPFHLAVSGGLAAIGTTLDAGDALLLMNIASPTAPSLVSTTPLGFNGKVDRAGIALTSTRAYLGADALGLAIFDVSKPATPSRIATGFTVGNAHGLALSGSLAFVADSPATSSVVGPLP